MNLIRLGLGGALLLTLGFSTSPEPTSGNYVTLGYGESAAKVLTLGLRGHAPESEGSYITLGTGQSASRFAMLGLSPGAGIPPVIVHSGGGGSFRIQVEQLPRMKLDRDDELLMIVVAAAAATLLDKPNG